MKEATRTHFLNWLEAMLSAAVPVEVVAFSLNLYDSPFWAEIVGSSYFDPDDEDWACEECWRPSEPNRFDFPDDMAELHWEARLAMVAACVQDWLHSGLPAARKSLASAAFAVGFVDGDLALVGECESALALFMQREGDVRAAARYARGVLANRAATLESRYRAFLALGSLHQDAYDYEEAGRLYREAEDVVRKLDDDIAMASWLQRSALTHAAHARQAAALGGLDARMLKAAVEALNRSIAFAGALPEGPDTTLDHLLLAEMRVLQGRYADALALYERHLPSAEGEGFLHEVTAATADCGHCCMQLGRIDEGQALLLSALNRVDESTPSDVRAIVHANMATSLKAAERAVEAEQHRTLAGMAWETYAHEQREARRLLAHDPTETLH